MENNKQKINSTLVREIDVDSKSSIRISKSMKEGDNVLCVDIRLFKLFPIEGHYDDVIKATPKGVHFSLDKLPAMLCALTDIYEEEYGKKFDRNEDGINE